MLIDRISLSTAYQALKRVELNEGKLSKILFNKSAQYGTKTVIRFETVEELRIFINKEYAFQMLYLNCQCGTCDESIWQLLSFTVELPNRRYISFVNNLRGDFESAEETLLNKTSIDTLKAVFNSNTILTRLNKDATCIEYVQNQGRYVSPCEYIELETNAAYEEMVTMYQTTDGIAGLERREVFVNDCYDGIIEAPEFTLPVNWTATTQFTVAPGQTFTVSNGLINTPIVSGGHVQADQITHTVLLDQGGGFNSVDEVDIQIDNGPILTGIVSGTTIYFGANALNVILLSGSITITWTHTIVSSDSYAEITISG